MQIILWILYTILAAAPLIYWYLTRKFNYWRKLGINGPRPLPIFGSMLHQMYLRPQPDIELEWFQKYGKIYGYYFGTCPILTVCDPELIKTVLVKDFHLFQDKRQFPVSSKSLLNATGDDWKRIRSIVSPTFTSDKTKKMYPLIRECLNDFISHLESFAINKEDINIRDMYDNYTMDVIATCGFAAKINPYKDLENPFAVNAKKFFSPNILFVMALSLLPAFLINRFQKMTDNMTKYFQELLHLIIENRRKGDKTSNEKYNDFVQLLIEAEKDRDNSRDEMDSSESYL